ncbi:DNA polymerase III subunit delta' [Betaproteobacteria bacterium]|nr:DNA polymerase III subunit delta' [Betaproteobacteria bacterium]
MKTAEEEKRHAEIWRQLRSTTELHAASWQRLQAWRARLPHALLLSGARGLGKQDLARAFAASLLCESPKINGSACGECAACHWFEQGNHPDFRMLTKEVSMKAMDKEKSVKAGVSTDKDEKEEKSNRSGQEIIIDRVRELDEFFAVGSHRQKSRIILIYPAESLNAAAANAILKVLEEPPANTLFLLVSNEPMRLLPTLRSRCQNLAVPLPDAREAAAFLGASGLNEAATWLALAGGAPGLAIQLAAKTTDWAAPLTDALQRGDRLEVIATAANLEKALKAVKGENPLPMFVDWTQKWLVDLNLAARHLPIRFYLAQRAKIEALAQKSQPVKLTRFYRQLLQLRRESEHPLNLRLFLEQFFFRYRALFVES